MLSHIVVIWTDPEKPEAVEKVLAGARELLPGIPGVRHFHAGRMVPSDRPVVEQSYQIALNVIFTDAAAERAYQTHPDHVRFVEEVFQPWCVQVRIYDFA
jgi:hypothetical protein